MENETSVKDFNYENSEIKQMGGKKIIRKVSIKKGKGYKTIITYKRGKKMSSVKKPIHKEHLKMIKRGKFVKGLFNDCKNCNKTKKSR